MFLPYNREEIEIYMKASFLKRLLFLFPFGKIVHKKTLNLGSRFFIIIIEGSVFLIHSWK